MFCRLVNWVQKIIQKRLSYRGFDYAVYAVSTLSKTCMLCPPWWSKTLRLVHPWTESGIRRSLCWKKMFDIKILFDGKILPDIMKMFVFQSIQ